jgi:hypothetical protein
MKSLRYPKEAHSALPHVERGVGSPNSYDLPAVLPYTTTGSVRALVDRQTLSLGFGDG